jgi:hypothetical protein
VRPVTPGGAWLPVAWPRARDGTARRAGGRQARARTEPAGGSLFAEVLLAFARFMLTRRLRACAPGGCCRQPPKFGSLDALKAGANGRDDEDEDEQKLFVGGMGKGGGGSGQVRRTCLQRVVVL